MVRVVAGILLLAGLGWSQTAPVSFPLDSVAVEGNRTVSAGAVLQAAGLTKGQKAVPADFDAARERLIASGYFQTVAYRYKPSKSGGVELALEVKEIETLYGVRVDALAVTTEEVVAYLKTVEPLFLGRMPGTKPAIDRASRHIEKLLESKQQPANPEHAAVGGKLIAAGPDRFEVNFTPARGLPVVAAVEFEGTKLIPAIDLRNKMAEVAFGQPYTEAGFRLFLENQIRGQYEAKGHMNVMFPVIAAKPAADVLGLDLKVTVDEGEEYKVSRVTVEGVEREEAARILKAAKLPANLTQVAANAELVKEGAARVKEGMRHQGFLDATVTTDWKRDDAKKTVEFFFHVQQGEEYTFGRLTVNGLDLNGESAMRKIWSVKTGDSFPAEYPDYFLAQVKEQGLFDNLGDMKAETAVDRKRHTVDVVLNFRPAPPVARPRRRIQ